MDNFSQGQRQYLPIIRYVFPLPRQYSNTSIWCSISQLHIYKYTRLPLRFLALFQHPVSIGKYFWLHMIPVSHWCIIPCNISIPKLFGVVGFFFFPLKHFIWWSCQQKCSLNLLPGHTKMLGQMSQQQVSQFSDLLAGFKI